jgi:hypothetical protein
VTALVPQIETEPVIGNGFDAATGFPAFKIATTDPVRVVTDVTGLATVTLGIEAMSTPRVRATVPVTAEMPQMETEPVIGSGFDAATGFPAFKIATTDPVRVVTDVTGLATVTLGIEAMSTARARATVPVTALVPQMETDPVTVATRARTTEPVTGTGLRAVTSVPATWRATIDPDSVVTFPLGPPPGP